MTQSARPLPDAVRLYLYPLGLVPAATLSPGSGYVALAGGLLAFRHCTVVQRGAGGIAQFVAPLPDILAWGEAQGGAVAARLATLAERLTGPRASPLGGTFDRPLLMGIVNVTPDSFSDGGQHLDPATAVAQALRLRAEGADILDIGGESVRPGATPVPADSELARVLPVIEALAARPAELGGAVISIDSRKAAVQRAALAAGAGLLNDVSALTYDAESLAVAAASDVPIVLMHMPKGELVAEEAALEVYDYLESRIEACLAAGIARDRLILDPGIGFGKRGADNLAILRRLALLHGLGCPVMVGVSRKGLTGALDRRYAPGERLAGSLAGALAALGQGAQLLRVHDVAATRQAVDVWRGVLEPG